MLLPSKTTPIDDYRQLALQRIIEQYKNSPNLVGLLDSAGLQSNDMETALWEIRDLFYLDTAEGIQLDIIGKIFTPRLSGESDADYRQRLKLFAAQKFSGTPEEIITTLKVFFGATTVEYFPLYPAAFAITTDATITPAELQRLAPAGVGIGTFDFLVDATGDPIVDAVGDYIYVINVAIN